MEASQSWPQLIEPILAKNTPIRKVINASISGDTTGNGLERLPELLKLHQPNWILIELGANDGLRGFPIKTIEKNLDSLIRISQENNVKTMLMQIQAPPNYGKRYSRSFYNMYLNASKKFDVPLLPFFLEQVILKKAWMMKDGLHPTAAAQPWIANYIAKEMTPYLNGSK